MPVGIQNDVAHTRYAVQTAYATTEGLANGGPFWLSKRMRTAVSFFETRTRFAVPILIVALLAALAVTAMRVRAERPTIHQQRIEIAMDYADFLTLARSYNYRPDAFLVALRHAGLTSLALAEELGANINNGSNAYVTSGVALLDSARLAPVTEPTLAALVRAKRVSADELYLVIYDRDTYDRYRAQLPLHFSSRSVHVLHASAPWVIAVRTQLDYFNTVSLGIPDDQLALARKLGLLIVPRFQNDERLQGPKIARVLAAPLAYGRVSTVVFFGLRNQVLGFPDHVEDTAAFMHAHRLMFGSIETYDPSQIQKGNDELARFLPWQTVRVQAIAKLEQDKLTLPEIVARYLLGARERNIRVVYLRPFGHEYNGMTIEGSNVEMVRLIKEGLQARGFVAFGRATSIPGTYHGNNRVLVFLATLAAPSLFVLLLGTYGWYRPAYAIAAYVATLLLYAGGLMTHHDMLARSVIALAAALLFSAAAFTAVAGGFFEEPSASSRAQLARSVRWTLIAAVVALLGALAVIGIMSSPLAMEEIERFRGVKAVLGVPPLIALALYFFTARFGAKIDDPAQAFNVPVRLGQLLLGVAIVAAGTLVLLRSGNQSDIAPSAFELSLRSGLTSLLSVRPRFKEFLIGFPALMLIPALLPVHRRAVGWLLALGAGICIGDVIDTFSHLHTPVVISLVRVVLGLAIGVVVGFVFILVYRRFILARAR